MDQIKKSLRFFGFCCCVCVVIIWFSPINQANAAETKMISEATVAPVEMEQEAEEDETVEIEIG